MSRPAVFLDRDGVLIENVSSYVRTWGEVSVFPYTIASLRRLKAAGLPVFVVTNQAIVGRGLMQLEEINSLHDKIIEAIDPDGAIVKSYLCPHSPDEECDCRKPLPGSLLKAAAEFDIDLSKSTMVGDAQSDVQAGLSAGTMAILVETGRGKSQIELVDASKVTIVPSLLEAVDHIIDGLT